MDCGRCGLRIECPRDGDVFFEDEKIVCSCGTTNQIGCDEGPVFGPTVSVSHWTCKHGSDDETPCAACDAEDVAARSPSPATEAKGGRDGR
jgi:hypothetical protein